MSNLETQYQNATHLNARIALHSRFGKTNVAWFPWVFSHLTLSKDARVLELGSGPGKLWAENLGRIPVGWQITLSDLSAGMLAEARATLQNSPQPFEFKAADAQDLPFEDGTFEAVIANHMLYHVPAIQQALREIRRVLKPGGRLFAATNGEAHMRELDALSQDLSAGGALSDFHARTHVSPFNLENAPGLLERHFSRVILHRPEGDPDLYVTEAEPLVSYLLSCLAEPARAETKDVLALYQRLRDALQQTGYIRITRATGLFEALT